VVAFQRERTSKGAALQKAKAKAAPADQNVSLKTPYLFSWRKPAQQSKSIERREIRIPDTMPGMCALGHSGQPKQNLRLPITGQLCLKVHGSRLHDYRP
jgi:hypothetical protein